MSNDFEVELGENVVLGVMNDDIGEGIRENVVHQGDERRFCELTK